MTTPESSEPAGDREFVHMRVLDAPREAVFRAFSDPEQLAAWWGPKGFTNTFQRFLFRPGERWLYVMRGPNGHEHANESVFAEIAEPERVVIHHLGPMHEFFVTVTLEEREGKTLLTWRMVFDSVAEHERVRPFVPEANEQNLDRLEALLESRKRPS